MEGYFHEINFDCFWVPGNINFMYTHSLLQLSLKIAIVIGAVALLQMAALAHAQDKPHVVLIMIDDLNDYVGALGGHPQAHTPNIDRFLNSSSVTNFTNAHTPAPACMPARTALMSGLSPDLTGITRNNSPNLRKARDKAFSQHETLPMYLSDKSYFTYSLGKIDHSRVLTNDWDVVKSGSDISVEFVELLSKKTGVPLHKNGKKLSESLNGLNLAGDFDYAPVDNIPEHMWRDHKVTNWATSFLKQREGNTRPFFLGYGLYLPHLPWYCPAEYYDLIADSPDDIILPGSPAGDLDDVGTIAQNWSRANNDTKKFTNAGELEQKKALHSYLACGAFVDAQFGRFMKTLEQRSYYDNTIIILVSDHGWQLGEKDSWKKFKLWEESTRVPFGIKLPSHMLVSGIANKNVGVAVSTGSIYETIRNVLEPKAAYEQATSYRSLLPLLDLETADQWKNAPVFTYNGSVNNVSMRRNNYRYTRYSDGFEEFYDHIKDPNEYINFAYTGTLTSAGSDLSKSIGINQSRVEWLVNQKLPETRELFEKQTQ